MKTMQFEDPQSALKRLQKKYDCPQIHMLRTKLNVASAKKDRELYYGALFAEALNRTQLHKYLIRMPEEDKDCDCELLDHTEFQNGQKSLETKKFNHFLLQNVSITEYAVREQIKRGVKNMYVVFKEHLIRTKLSKKAGDYSGCILVFYVGIRLRQKMSLQKLRNTLRSVEQSQFQQIWIIAPDNTKYAIAELLRSEDGLLIADFTN